MPSAYCIYGPKGYSDCLKMCNKKVKYGDSRKALSRNLKREMNVIECQLILYNSN
jgi:hypothetical protein